MMNLIDREELINYIYGNMPLDLQEKIVMAVENQPIAFDINKVIEEITEKSKTMTTKKFPHKYYKAIGTRDCEEIIRNGGIYDKE